jgi:lysophospholipase L1-like esterase
MRLMRHLTGNGPAPMIAAAAMAIAVALSTGAEAVASPARPAPVATAAVAKQEAKERYLRIMPLGDSLTFGKGDPSENGYRRDLHAWLTDAGVRADFVGSQRNGTFGDLAHEGHPGWRIDWVTRHVDEWMLRFQPQVVLLDIGTNDLLRGRVAGAPQRLAELVDRILAADPNTQIVLAKLLVVPGRNAKAFRDFNAAVARLAARHPYSVTLVDMSRISPVNTVDNVHPNQLGYRQMAFQWYQGLRRVLPTGRSMQPVANPFTAGMRARRR